MRALREVTKAGILMGTVAGACRLASMGKELLVAALFGAGLVTDTYWLAMLVPIVVMGTLTAAVRASYLTIFPQSVDSESQEANRFAVGFLVSLVGVAICIASLLAIFLPSLWSLLVAASQSTVVDSGVDSGINSGKYILVLASALIVPMSAASGLTAVLNARGRFAWPQFTALLPTAGIVLSMLFGSLGRGAELLLSGLLAGSVLQAIALTAMAWRLGIFRRAEESISSGGSSGSIQKLWAVALPLILLGALTQLNVYVDRSMASALPAGKIAILSWAAMTRDFLSGTLIGSFLWVLLPHMSHQAASGDPRKVWQSCSELLRYSAIVLFPLIGLVVIVCPALVPAIQFGQFSSEAAGPLSSCIVAYTLGLFAEMTGASLFQALLVMGRLRRLLVLGFVASFLPNLLLNLLLIGPYGEVGLAMSTAITAHLTLAANYLALRHLLGRPTDRNVWRDVAACLLATFVMSIAGLWVLDTARHVLPDQPPWHLAAAAIASTVAMGVYVASLSFLPVRYEARQIIRFVLRRRGEGD